MRISSLEISNIRAIDRVVLEDLAQVVLIAGPNGCGKSCIFDSIRLLKSCYGGYQPNEWQQWFGEYGINLNRGSGAIGHLFRNKNQPIYVSAEFELTASEKQFLNDNLDTFAESLAWEIVAPHTQNFQVRPIARDTRAYEGEVAKRRDEICAAVRERLTRPRHRGTVEINSSQEILTEPSPLLELIFSAYEPESLGIIDFHGSNRVYNREQLGNISLSIETSNQKERQSRLYNYVQKYSNIKSEMATTYVRRLLAKELGLEDEPGHEPITETLKELFKTFFPGKTFLGPVPTGDHALSFPVRVGSDIEHDINDLSSGEKEVLFGYLRLRNNSPRNSVILLDEPEMHLNPGLIKGLPQFYKKHIGEAMDNQLWLVTHSDAFLREAVGQHGFDVFHMQHAAQVRGGPDRNQLVKVTVEGEIEQAVIDLVGDLATFKPGDPVIIFEGENSEFDLGMTCRLFPQVESQFNPIAAGNKTNARKLHRLLREAGSRVAIAEQFFTIVDQDLEPPEDADDYFTWPAYHIENFLLDPHYVRVALQDLTITAGIFSDVHAVERALQQAAEHTIATLVRHKLQNYANDKLIRSIRVQTDRRKGDISSSLSRAVIGSMERLNQVVAEDLAAERLREREETERTVLKSSLEDGTWRQKLRGRDVLRRFIADGCGGRVKYEFLRDLVVSRMRDDAHQPEGMKEVIEKILSRRGVRT